MALLETKNSPGERQASQYSATLVSFPIPPGLLQDSGGKDVSIPALYPPNATLERAPWQDPMDPGCQRPACFAVTACAVLGFRLGDYEIVHKHYYATKRMV